MFCIDAPKENDLSQIDKLLDKSFGANRYEKTAYRLRDAVPAVEELSFVGRIDGVIRASLQFWPVQIVNGDNSEQALLLGPIAVDEGCRGMGFGLRLMEHGLVAAKKLGHQRVILVGDEAYYQKVGFSRALGAGLEMPGPIDKERLLVQELVSGAMDGVTGMISKIK